MDEITVSDSYTEYLIEDSYYTEYQITEDVERGTWGRTWTIPIPYGAHGFGFKTWNRVLFFYINS